MIESTSLAFRLAMMTKTLSKGTLSVALAPRQLINCPGLKIATVAPRAHPKKHQNMQKANVYIVLARWPL